MSEPNLPASIVFTNPLAVSPPPAGTNPNAVTATGAPVQLGGTGVSWATTPAAPGQTAQVVVSGDDTSVDLGPGSAYASAIQGGSIIESVQLVDSEGNPIDAGKILTAGNPNVPYSNTPIDNTTVVSGGDVSSSQTIYEAAGYSQSSDSPAFAFYIHGGTGADTIRGSAFADFLRGGQGDDSINAGAGNDLVRGGAGNDRVFLGKGLDTIYYTVDQVGDANTDLLVDFTSGADQIKVEAGLKAEISDDGRSILFTNTATGATTTLISQQDQFKQSDINFLA